MLLPDSNLTLHSYHVTALLVYLMEIFISSIFLEILHFFKYNPHLPPGQSPLNIEAGLSCSSFFTAFCP